MAFKSELSGHLLLPSTRVELNIIVNGNEKETTDGMAVSELIIALGLKPEQVAIEVNRKIVRRAEWPSTTLSEGDKVEVVHFVGGGA
jgi:thiamine biosynthesis protein ThiS